MSCSSNVVNTDQNILNILTDVVNKVDKRSSWNEYFMGNAIWVSTRSPSERLKVGAVIVKHNRILSAGYNGFPAGVPHISIMKDTHEQNTIHAEQNAICDVGRRGGTKLFGSTIYITHYPCINCCKSIIASGIKKVKYHKDYRNDPIVEQLFTASDIEIEKI